jgi:hypothetical protein
VSTEAIDGLGDIRNRKANNDDGTHGGSPLVEPPRRGGF